MSDIRVEKVIQFEDSTYEIMRDLLKDLYPTRPLLSREQCKVVMEDDHSQVFVAKKDGEIVGMSTLAWYRKFAGDKWFIEDVVVDERMRGQGIGSLLNESMLKEAQESGADFIDVDTRSPEAYKFYLKLGFKDKTAERPLFVLRYQLKV
ncbi:MAG: GNAT family N-acetyltransferase [Patescibacteria group bacterium]